MFGFLPKLSVCKLSETAASSFSSKRTKQTFKSNTDSRAAENCYFCLLRRSRLKQICVYIKMIDFTLNIFQLLMPLAVLSVFNFILDCFLLFAHAHTHSLGNYYFLHHYIHHGCSTNMRKSEKFPLFLCLTPSSSVHSAKPH